MADSSPLQAIESAIVAALHEVPDLADDDRVVILPAHEAMKDGEIVIQRTLPNKYPGAVVSLAERDIEIVGGQTTMGEGGIRIFRVPVWVSLYATSPSGGAVANDAKHEAWRIKHLIDIEMVVTSWSFGGVTAFPIDTKAVENLPTDANTHGLMLIFSVDYQINVRKS